MSNLGMMTDQPPNTLTVDDDDSPPRAAEACCDGDPDERPKLADLLYQFRRACQEEQRLAIQHREAVEKLKAARSAIVMNAAQCGVEPGLAVVAYDSVFEFLPGYGFRCLPMKYAHEMDAD